MSDHDDDYDIGDESSPGPSKSRKDSKGKPKSNSSIKKRKLNRACDVCRKRKVRCDFVELPSGSLEKCLNCFSSQVSCTFSEDAKPRESVKSYIQNLEAKLRRTEQLVQMLCPDPLQRENLMNGNLASLPATSTHSGVSTPLPPSDSQSGDRWSPARITTTTPPDEHLASGAGATPGVIRHPSGDLKYFLGESSANDLVTRTLRMKTEWQQAAESAPAKDPTRRAEFWSVPPWEFTASDAIRDAYPRSTFKFPSDPLLSELVSLYFRHSNLELPLLQRPIIDERIQSKAYLDDFPFATVTLLMCAIGARYSDDPEVMLTDDDIEESIKAFGHGEAERERWRRTAKFSRGWKYFRQVLVAGRSRRTMLACHEQQEALCIPLAAIYIRYTSMSHSAWAVVGVGLRILQSVGIHRDRSTESGDDFDPVEQEQWRRIWWVLICLDRYTSCELGRSLSVHAEEFDQVIPIDCDDEYWHNPDPKLCFKQPDDKPSLITGFNLQIGLVHILGIVIRTIYSTKSITRFLNVDRQDWDEKVVSGITSWLNDWLSSLPSHLQWNANISDERFFVQSARLHIIYHYVQLLTHWPFLVSPDRGESTSFPSLAICTTSARSISRIGQALLDRTGEIAVDFIHPVFIAAVVLLLKTWDPSRSASGSFEAQREKDLEDVHRCLDILRAAEKRSYKAGRASDVLSGLSFKASDDLRVAAMGDEPKHKMTICDQGKGRIVDESVSVFPPTTSDPMAAFCKLQKSVASEFSSSRNSNVPSRRPSTPPTPFSRPSQTMHSSGPGTTGTEGFLSGPVPVQADWGHLWQMISEETGNTQNGNYPSFSFEDTYGYPPTSYSHTQHLTPSFAQSAGQPIPPADHFARRRPPINPSHRRQAEEDFGMFQFYPERSRHSGPARGYSGTNLNNAPNMSGSNNVWDWTMFPQETETDVGLQMFSDVLPTTWDDPRQPQFPPKGNH